MHAGPTLTVTAIWILLLAEKIIQAIRKFMSIQTKASILEMSPLKDGDMDLLVAGITVCYNFVGAIYRNNLNPPKKEQETETSIFINAPLPKYDRGPFYYYVFSSCYCDPSGGDHPKYHLYISNIHKEPKDYDLNYKFNRILLKTVPNWGKADRGHRTSNGFVTKKEAAVSRAQVIESYKSTGFEVHYINW